MNLRLTRLAITTLCICVVAAAAFAAPAQPSNGNVTVRDFTVRLAATLNDTGREITTIDQAKQFFVGRGISLPVDLNMDAALTQHAIAELCNAMGINVQADEPSKLIDGSEIAGYVGFVRDELTQDSNATDTGNLSAEDRKKVSPQFALGGCCISGVCSQLTRTQCLTAGGGFKGVGVPCTPDPCGAGVGTCCLGKGGPCIFTTQAACTPPARWRGTLVCTPKTCSREPESPSQP